MLSCQVYLPDQVRSRVLDRLKRILDGDDDSPEFAHLTPKMRREILEILRETKPEFKRIAKLAVYRP